MFEHAYTESRLGTVIPEEVHDDPTKVWHAMGEIETELADAGLEHVIPFNAVYRQLTATVLESVDQSMRALDPGYRRFILGTGGVPEEPELQQPDTVARTVGIFADYYFKQLRAHIAGTPEEVDPAWQLLFYPEDAKKALPGVQFLLGMNAHINYDLPQALRDSGVHDDYYDDYTTVVGKLIELTAEKLAPEYVPAPGLIRQPIIDYAVNTIAQWREDAWQSGVALMIAERHNTGRRSDGDIAVRAIMNLLDRETMQTGESVMRLGKVALRSLGCMPPWMVSRLSNVTMK